MSKEKFFTSKKALVTLIAASLTVIFVSSNNASNTPLHDMYLQYIADILLMYC